MKEEIKNHSESNMREEKKDPSESNFELLVKKHRSLSIWLGLLWIGFSVLVVVLSYHYIDKNKIDVSIILISNATFFILFVTNTIILGLLLRKRLRDDKDDNKDKVKPSVLLEEEKNKNKELKNAIQERLIAEITLPKNNLEPSKANEKKND